MKCQVISTFVLFLFVVGCNLKDGQFSSTEIVKELELKHISSGSGMSFFRSHYYIIGDDDSFLWKVNSDGEIINKWQVWDTAYVKNQRIASKYKPDFEATTFATYKNDTLLIIFGSGSKSPKRDVIITFNPKTFELFQFEQQQVFFHNLKEYFNLSEKEINIEATAIYKDSLYLFNRHNNFIYSISTEDFFMYKKNENNISMSMNSKHFELPTFENDTARFSGANFIEGTSLLLFSATIEKTGNWEKDGGIAGSFIGIIDFSTKKLLACLPVKTNNGDMYIGKIEGVYGKKENGNILVNAITDNDDGTTIWLEILVK